jgi:hypothetical protein
VAREELIGSIESVLPYPYYIFLLRPAGAFIFTIKEIERGSFVFILINCEVYIFIYLKPPLLVSNWHCEFSYLEA